tara:strand:+ start:75 stop:569 length:495 start_codon:yes stop_codon:yes gene_type:complete
MYSNELTTIHINKEHLHFSSAHFTIFSDNHREDLHGHTFYVSAVIDCLVNKNGLAFDYNLIKDALNKLCSKLDEKVLLPTKSPYLEISQEDEYLVAHFGNERIPFLPRDVHLMPLRNITAEELAMWFLEELVKDTPNFASDISKLVVKVSSGPGQSAESTWEES